MPRTDSPATTLQRANAALSTFPDHRPHGGVTVFERQVAHPVGAGARCAVASWWTPGGSSRAVAPFIADALRRAGLVTTEPHGSSEVYFAPQPPADQISMRFRLAPAVIGGGWGLVDQFTGACVHTYGDPQWAKSVAEGAEREADAARQAAVASLELPGLAEDLIEDEQFRALAVELSVAGLMPYGLPDIDYTRTPGFQIYRSAGTAKVARVLEPWGSVRPGARFDAPGYEAERYDRDMEAYAQLLGRPGRAVTVEPDGLRVQLDNPPL
ncbi:hypothetical protein [Streptomyces melanogenes]|uniref:hypothetical protein n=1 Tax=Streptomyces melanogenes TaxID=67326 RepID=UPI00167E24DA|nr:hypothetical protein [Streptomyces melanogenes]GGP80877.1 hypothetical protein GCM10010278_69280 [Streptomyces melanogenes]